MMFEDRREAGRTLARSVAALPNLKDAVVLGLPRGGVPVAFEVARTCKLPLDVLVVRKLGAPVQEELAVGAIASGGTVVLNQGLIHALQISSETLHAMVERETREMERQERLFRDGGAALRIEGRDVILVDDGLATGATMRAAARAVRPRAGRVVIAVPVGARSTCAELRSEADWVVCVSSPEPFDAVGRFYRNFEPTSDEEVRALLAEARQRPVFSNRK